MAQVIGWTASVVLVATIGWQVLKQWREQTSRGVSLWLFIGQMTANSLFLAYALIIGDLVFMTANAFLLATSLVGLLIKLHHGRTPAG